MNLFMSWHSFCENNVGKHRQICIDRTIASPATPLWKVLNKYRRIPIQHTQLRLLGGNTSSTFSISSIFFSLIGWIIVFFPLAWFFSSTLLSKRFGGSVLTHNIEKNVFFNQHWTNQSIHTLVGTDVYGEDPFRGAVSIENRQPLWIMSIMSSLVYWIFHWVVFLTQFQTNRSCNIPTIKTLVYHLFAMLFPFVSVALSFFIDRKYYVSSQTVFQGKKEWWTYWSAYSMIITVVITCILLAWDTLSAWNACVLNEWVIAFILLIISGVYFMLQYISEPWLQLVRRTAMLFGIHVKEGEENQSFFVRYAWITTIGLPVFMVAAFIYSFLLIRNNMAVC